MSQSRDLVVPEGGHSVPSRGLLTMLMGVVRQLQGLPCMLLSRQVILLSLLLGDTMSMRGDVV